LVKIADYFVRIKTEQIKPILQVILQLYDGQSQDIKVGAYEAHTLGNIETFEMDKYYKLFPDLVEKIHYNFYFCVNLNKITNGFH
jgi:hypothetical protein